VAVGERRQENTFIAEKNLPWQGYWRLFFPIGIETKERRKSKKEKKRTKRKEKIYYLYICFLKDKRIKEYIYILVCGERVAHGLVHTLATFVDSIGVWLVRVPVDLLVHTLVHTSQRNAGFIGV
jgi:hypothetical protein